MQTRHATSARLQPWLVLAQHDFVIQAFPGRESEAAHRSAETIALSSGQPVRIYAVAVQAEAKPPEPGVPVPSGAGWCELEEEPG